MRFGSNVVIAVYTAFLAFNPIGVDAVPAQPVTPRSDGMVHMPLSRMSATLAKRGVHPAVVHQQHANRANARLAHMTGRTAPTHEEMHAALRKRMFLAANELPELGAVAKSKSAEERMFVPKQRLPSTPSSASRRSEKKRMHRVAGVRVPLHRVSQGGPHDSGRHGGHHSAAVTNEPTTGGDGVGAGAKANSTQGFPKINADASSSNTITDSVVSDGNSTLGLDVQANDVSYFSTVQIGTPPKNFKIIMDSGSADFWVQGVECLEEKTREACSSKHQNIGTSSSSSLKDSGTKFQVTYGSGAVAGTTVTDDVTIAGLSLKALSFGVAQLETDDFAADSVPTDGLMGLAQSSLSNQNILTPLEQLAKEGTIKEAIAAYKISRLADEKNDGQITFGGLDASLFDASTLVEIPNVSQKGFWEGAVDKVTVDGKDLGLDGRTAILDTGTTLILVPEADAEAIHAAIPGSKSDGSGSYTIPCTTSQTLALTFGGQSFAIDPRDILFLPADENDLTGDCISGIMVGSVGGDNEWLVGDVFLKNAYFATDVGKNQISLAKFV